MTWGKNGKFMETFHINNSISTSANQIILAIVILQAAAAAVVASEQQHRPSILYLNRIVHCLHKTAVYNPTEWYSLMSCSTLILQIFHSLQFSRSHTLTLMLWHLLFSHVNSSTCQARKCRWLYTCLSLPGMCVYSVCKCKACKTTEFETIFCSPATQRTIDDHIVNHFTYTCINKFHDGTEQHIESMWTISLVKAMGIEIASEKASGI